MANEKRLIDANALIDAIEDIDWYHVNAKGKLVDGANPANNTPIYKAFDIYNAIKNAPTVDAVEVVRCKDCKHWMKDVAGCTDSVGRCEWANYMVGAVGYCVYGERKEA